MTYRKVGGLHFIRAWRVSCSFCLCRSAQPKQREIIARKINPPMLRSRVVAGKRVIAFA